MRDPQPTPEEPGKAVGSRFGRFHARTYEMELLISGALVFGLLQLPHLIYGPFEHLRAGLVGDLRWMGNIAQVYVMMALYVLIATFLFHLALRAYWIGILGLESVFRHGIRWDRLRHGPLTIAAYRERLGSLAHAVDRADDLCSLVFSFGFAIVAVFVYLSVVVGISAASALAVAHLVLGGEHAVKVFAAMLGVLVGLEALAAFLDKRFGSRWAHGGTGARLVKKLVGAAYVISPMRWTGTIMLTLDSNLPPGRVGVAILIACSLFGAAKIGGSLADRGLLRFDNLDYFPSSLHGEGMDPCHYRDRREVGAIDPRIPSVQSRLVDGPYLELVVPYYPNRHNPLIESSCPGLSPLRSGNPMLGSAVENDPATVRAAAACIGSLFAVEVDNRSFASLHWDFTIEPGSRLPAVVSFLPVGDLDPGRHELEVAVPGRRASAEDPDTERHVIPFWR